MAKKKNDDEKAYEVKDKRRVNPDGSLKEEAASEAEPVEQPAESQTPEQPTEAPAEAKAEEQPPAPEAEQAAEAPGPEPVLSGDEGAEMPPPNVFETLQFVTGLLAEQAWQFMGLHLPPGHKEPVVDMAQAKVAIDVVISIADKLHPHLDDESRRAIRGIISDLQINFVQHNK